MSIYLKLVGLVFKTSYSPPAAAHTREEVWGQGSPHTSSRVLVGVMCLVGQFYSIGEVTLSEK
jgi:hypothetical protein